MSKYIDLNKSQKDEIRRLTQLANRRIKSAERAYRKAGRRVIPAEIAGRGQFQIKEGWATRNTPISRSVKFESQRDYRQQLRFLREFETRRPGIKEYTEVQRDKTKIALETSLGVAIPGNIDRLIDSLSAPDLARFWDIYSKKASRMGVKYSSLQALQDTVQEFFSEDEQALFDELLEGA